MGAGASSESDSEPTVNATSVIVEQATDPEALRKLHKSVESEVFDLRKFIAIRDADDISRACSSNPIDHPVLISILCNRTKVQLQRIDAAYADKYGKSLTKVTVDDIGEWGGLVGYSLENYDVLNAKFLEMALSGKACNTTMLTDVACSHSNAEIKAIKTIFNSKNSLSLEDTIKKELKGDIFKIIYTLFQGDRSENQNVDETLAQSQAEQLYRGGVGKVFGTDEALFIEILCKASRAQIQAIKTAYKNKYGETLEQAIRKEFRSETRQVLTALLNHSIEASIACSLSKALEGAECDKNRIIRILSSLDKARIPTISNAFLEIRGLSLQDTLKDELVGDFRNAVVTWITDSDPSHGLELCNKDRSTTNDIELRAATLDLAKERSTLLDFVALTDALTIQRACVGEGTRDKPLIEVLCARSKVHLKRVDAYYQKLFGKSLVDQIHEETDGYYRQLMEYALLPSVEVDAMVTKQACDALGVDDLLLTEVLAALSNKRLHALKAKYIEKYGVDLMEFLSKEMKGTLLELNTALLHSARDETKAVDEKLAVSQAMRLKATADGIRGTETTFIEVVTHCSFAQLDCIKKKFLEKYGSSLEDSVRGDTNDPVRGALAAITSNPDDIYASALYRAFRGVNTDDSAVARIFGSNDKKDLVRITTRYMERYGQTLIEAIMSNLTGNFQLACVTYVATADPIMPEDLRAITDHLSLEGDERMPTGPVDVPQGRIAKTEKLRSVLLVTPVANTEGNDDDLNDYAESSDGGEGSGHSSDEPGPNAGWKMTPELRSLFNKKRQVSRGGHRFKTRMISKKIKSLIAGQTSSASN
jgi:hypothetical protein